MFSRLTFFYYCLHCWSEILNFLISDWAILHTVGAHNGTLQNGKLQMVHYQIKSNQIFISPAATEVIIYGRHSTVHIQ
jgi:hypothetical protein